MIIFKYIISVILLCCFLPCSYFLAILMYIILFRGSPDVNTHGQLIEDFITSNILCILSNGEDTYFHEPSKTFHAIDLVICTPILFPFFNFLVSNDLHNSDHFPIFLSFRNSNSTHQKNLHYIYIAAKSSRFSGKFLDFRIFSLLLPRR